MRFFFSLDTVSLCLYLCLFPLISESTASVFIFTSDVGRVSRPEETRAAQINSDTQKF